MQRKYALLLAVPVIVVVLFFLFRSNASLKFQKLSVGKELQHLTDFVFIPDALDQSLLLLNKGGRVVLAETGEDGKLTSKEFTFDDTTTTGGCGLFSIALDPDFVTNSLFYIAHCDAAKHPTITRFKLESTFPNTETTATTVWKDSSLAINANVFTIGKMVFDDEKNLLFGLGDAAVVGAAQNPNSILGKILRITPRRSAEGYTVPSTNPFLDGSGNPLVFAYGLKNPWQLFLENGSLWIADRRSGSSTNIYKFPYASGKHFAEGMSGRCADCERPAFSYNRAASPVFDSGTLWMAPPELSQKLASSWSLAATTPLLIGDWCSKQGMLIDIDAPDLTKGTEVKVVPYVVRMYSGEKGTAYLASYMQGIPTFCPDKPVDPAAVPASDRVGSLWEAILP